LLLGGRKMTKKKISKKREFYLKDIPTVEIKNQKGLTAESPSKILSDQDMVGRVLLQCLIEGDPESFLEILDSFLRVNRKQTAKESGLARSTVIQVFSKKGNPTLKTIAKIVQSSVMQNTQSLKR
jgi:DNA-binding phage protein